MADIDPAIQKFQHGCTLVETWVEAVCVDTRCNWRSLPFPNTPDGRAAARAAYNRHKEQSERYGK